MGTRLLMTPGQVAAYPGAWHARRRQTEDGRWCVTASEIPLVLGIAPKNWGGPFKLYHAKLRGDDLRDTDEMRRGRACEPIVLGEFADQWPGLLRLAGGLYASAGDDRWLATLDAQAMELDAFAATGAVLRDLRTGDLVNPAVLDAAEVMTVQVKTSIPTDGWGWAEDSTEVPDHVRAQVLWEMMVRGAKLACVACKFMTSWRTRFYWIELDDRARAEIAFMTGEAEAFCKRLDARDEPDVDWFPATTETLHRMHDGIEDREVRIPWALALQYRAVTAASAALRRRRGLVTNQILHRAGGAGTIVARQWNTGKIIRIATHTAGPVAEHTVKRQDRVHRLNPGGWAKRQGRWAE